MERREEEPKFQVDEVVVEEDAADDYEATHTRYLATWTDQMGGH